MLWEYEIFSSVVYSGIPQNQDFRRNNNSSIKDITSDSNIKHMLFSILYGYINANTRTA